MKEIKSKVQPNHKECSVWIDLTADPHGSVKKHWDGTKWVAENNGVDEQVKMEVDQLKTTIEKLTKIIHELQVAFDTFQQYDDTKLHNRINKLISRVEKIENNIIVD